MHACPTLREIGVKLAATLDRLLRRVGVMIKLIFTFFKPLVKGNDKRSSPQTVFKPTIEKVKSPLKLSDISSMSNIHLTAPKHGGSDV